MGFFIFSQKYQNIDQYVKFFFFEILVLTALTVGLIWTILKLTPKSALLSILPIHESLLWIPLLWPLPCLQAASPCTLWMLRFYEVRVGSHTAPPRGHPNMTSTFLRGGGMSSLPCSTRFTKSDGWEKSFILLPYEKRPKSNFCNIFWVFWNMYITLKIILWYDCIKICSAYFASVIWVKWKQSFHLCIVAV